MSVNLTKGQKVDLTKGNKGLKNIVVGLGWDVNKYDGGATFDLDSSVFCLNASGKVNSDKDFVYYGNLTHESGAIRHLGDNLTGAGDGDDEQIKIDLSAIPEEIEKLDFVVTIYQAATRRQNFGQVRNSYIRIYDAKNNEDIARYDLDEDFSIETAVEFGRLYRHAGGWKFEAMGIGNKGGLPALVNKYAKRFA